MPEAVALSSPVPNPKNLSENMANLKKGSSPGAGGCRMEFLVTLAEVLEPERMHMLEDLV